MSHTFSYRKSNKTKPIIIVTATAALILLVIVCYLIVKVSSGQPKETVYTETIEQDNGSGLAMGSKESSGGTDVSLPGIYKPNSSGSKTLPPPNSNESLPKTVRAQTLDNGLKIDEYVFGTSERATKTSDTLTVHYVGYLENGQVFDTSLKGNNNPFSFKLGAKQVISGWDIGLQDMHQGAIRRLTIPSNLAYGAKGYPPSIPPNATLIFDVLLVAIQ